MKAIKKYFSDWNWFELSILIAAFIVPPAIGIAVESNIWEILAPMFGMAVAVLYAKAKLEAYILTFFSVGFYLVVAIQAQFYSDIIYMVAIMMPITIYGLINWNKNQRKTDESKVTVLTNTRTLELVLVVASQAIMAVGYYFLLRHWDAQFLILSTISLAVGTAAMYLISRRFKWALAVHIGYSLTVLLWWALFIADGNPGATVMLINPIIFTVCDIYGTLKWRKLKVEQDAVKKV